MNQTDRIRHHNADTWCIAVGIPRFLVSDSLSLFELLWIIKVCDALERTALHTLDALAAFMASQQYHTAVEAAPCRTASGPEAPAPAAWLQW